MKQNCLSETDAAVWNAYTKTVTPLGQAKPSQSPPAVLTISFPFSNQIDLHGLTLAEAHSATMNYVERVHKTYRSVTIITGLSGNIRREFKHWFDNDPYVIRIEELNNGGAYRLFFKKEKR
jgi:DNA-nicking Smr family endonuclease